MSVMLYSKHALGLSLGLLGTTRGSRFFRGFWTFSESCRLTCQRWITLTLLNCNLQWILSSRCTKLSWPWKETRWTSVLFFVVYLFNWHHPPNINPSLQSSRQYSFPFILQLLEGEFVRLSESRRELTGAGLEVGEWGSALGEITYSPPYSGWLNPWFT